MTAVATPLRATLAQLAPQEKLFADARALLGEELNVFVVNTLGSSGQARRATCHGGGCVAGLLTACGCWGWMVDGSAGWVWLIKWVDDE